MLTWEGVQTLGAANIAEKLTVRPPPLCPHTTTPAHPSIRSAPQSLPFEKVLHKVTTFDAQPCSADLRNILVSVTGLLVVRPNLTLRAALLHVLT